MKSICKFSIIVILCLSLGYLFQFSIFSSKGEYNINSKELTSIKGGWTCPSIEWHCVNGGTSCTAVSTQSCATQGCTGNCILSSSCGASSGKTCKSDDCGFQCWPPCLDPCNSCAPKTPIPCGSYSQGQCVQVPDGSGGTTCQCQNVAQFNCGARSNC